MDIRTALRAYNAAHPKDKGFPVQERQLGKKLEKVPGEAKTSILQAIKDSAYYLVAEGYRDLVAKGFFAQKPGQNRAAADQMAAPTVRPGASASLHPSQMKVVGERPFDKQLSDHWDAVMNTGKLFMGMLPDDSLLRRLFMAETKLWPAIDLARKAFWAGQHLPVQEQSAQLADTVQKLNAVVDIVAKTPLTHLQRAALADYRGALNDLGSFAHERSRVGSGEFRPARPPVVPTVRPAAQPISVATLPIVPRPAAKPVAKPPPLPPRAPATIPDVFHATKQSVHVAGRNLFAELPNDPKIDRLFVDIARAQAEITDAIEAFAPRDGRPGHAPSIEDQEPLLRSMFLLNMQLDELGKQSLEPAASAALASYRTSLGALDRITTRAFLAARG
jgi:hypothetical protein